MKAAAPQPSPPLPKAAAAPLTPALIETPPVEELDEEKTKQRDAGMTDSLAERVLRPARPKAAINTGYADLVGAALNRSASSSPSVGASSGAAKESGSASPPGHHQTLTRVVRGSVHAEPTQSLQFKLATELVRDEEEEEERESAVQRKWDPSLAGDAPIPPDDEEEPVQRKDTGAGAPGVATTPSEIHAIARAGVESASEPLPHLDRIQPLLAPHDLSGVRTLTGGVAAEANARLGALGYTMGERIAFRSAPDVKLAAHEAAHVVQQRAGARVPNGLGQVGDDYERQADDVAVGVRRSAPTADPGERLAPVHDGFVLQLQSDPSQTPETPRVEAPKGAHEGQKVGLWGVIAPTELIAGKRLKEDFGTFEAASAYARGLGRASAIFQEQDSFVIYPVSYNTWFSTFEASDTRIFHGSNISDVMGLGGVLAFVTDDGTTILPHLRGTEADYRSWMEQQQSLKEGENPFDAHKEAFGEGLKDIKDKDKFLRQFELALRDTAFAMLDKSKRDAQQKRGALQGGLPTGDVATIHKVAAEVANIDQQLVFWRGKQSEGRAVVQNPVPFMQESNDRAYRELKEATQKVTELEVARRTALLDYPLLSQVDVAEFNKLDEKAQATMLHSTAGNVLENIETTRQNIVNGSLELWVLEPVVSVTLAGLGIEDAVKRGWVKDKVASVKHWDMAVSIALGVLQIGLAIAATAIGGPVGAVFAVGALGVGVADAVRITDQYFREKAAANTDIDKEASLLPADLVGHWAWVVVAWVGAGIGFLEAVKAVRAVKAGADLVETATRLAKQFGKDPHVLLSAMGKTAETASPAELRAVLLSALPEEAAATFKSVTVRVLEDADFARFGSKTGDAVLTFSKKGEGFAVEAIFRKGGNPLALREEAVHLAQAADKDMAAKLAQLSEGNLKNWAKLPVEQKLRLYRLKVEVEIDAQKRLLQQFARGDPEYLAEVEDTLKNLENRLIEVDDALKNPTVAKQGKLPWLEDEPPRLFAKARRLPVSNGHWSGAEGNSLWYSDLPEVKAITGGEGVPYRNGYPVYAKWTKETVYLEEMAGYSKDFPAADRALAKRWGRLDPERWLKPNGEPNASAVERWREANEYTWHHNQGGAGMQLVPRALNKLPHQGGMAASKVR